MRAKGHIVFLGHEAWSHVRPMCALAARIACSHDVYVTLLVSGKTWARAEVEVNRGFTPEVAHRREWLRLVGIPSEDFRFHPEVYFQSFQATYTLLVSEAPVTCSATHTEVEGIPAPSMVVIDFAMLEPFRIVRQLSKQPVKAIVFHSGASNFLCIQAAPVEFGGVPDQRAKITEEVEKTGRPLHEVAFKHLHDFGDELVHIPGLQPMHQYERDPQDVKNWIEPFVGVMWLSITTVMESLCDGIILASPEAYEPDGTAQVRKWMRNSGRDTWCLGPSVAIHQKQEEIPDEGNPANGTEDIQCFMNKTLAECGEQSLLYISFGSVFWSPAPEKIWAFLNAVMEKGIPFIFTHPSPWANIPDEVIATVEAYGRGTLTKWSPQQTVLAHPVVGWFLTHCGQNGVTEAIIHGVPMICWPFHADQPINASYLTQSLNVGYELIEVRTGKGMLPLYRTGKAPAGTFEALRTEALDVLAKAWGEDGNIKRENMRRLQTEVCEAWEGNGPASMEMEKFIEAVVFQ